MKSEFQASDFKKEIIQDFSEKYSDESHVRMANSVLRKLENFLEKPLDLERPQEVRDKIFEFYEDSDYETINSMHISPIKQLLEKAGENSEDELLMRNARMVKDNIKKEYLTDSEDRIKRLDRKILSEEEKSNLQTHFNGSKRLVIKLFLETSAKISALSAITEEDVDLERNKIYLNSQYKQEGEKPLPARRDRRVDISDELTNLYRSEIDEDPKYIFGKNSRDSYHKLREIIREIDREFEVEISSSVLRDTSGYFKFLKMDSEDQLMRALGLKSTIKIQRFSGVRELREN